jgi:hypothetical protein
MSERGRGGPGDGHDRHDGHDGPGRGDQEERDDRPDAPGHPGSGRPCPPDTGPTETVDLHVALGHLPGVRQFQLHTGGSRRVALRPHTRDTLAAHTRRNRALGLLEGPGRARFTHYAEGVALPTDRVTLLRVSYPGSGSIPELALLATHVPGWAMRAARERELHRDGAGIPVPLAVVGVTRAVPAEQELAAAADADLLLSTVSTAATLVSMHPQLATIDTTTAATVMNGHILSTDNLGNIQRFNGQISRQGTAWQASTVATDIKGQPLVWGPTYAQSGKPVMYNRLSDATVLDSAAAMKRPLNTSQQDALLRNASWSVNQGTGAVSHVAPAAAQAQRTGRATAKAAMRRATAADGGYAFTLDNLTPGPGLTIDDTSLAFTPDPTTRGAGTISVVVSNNFLRTLYAFAQFYDDHGAVIPVQNGDGSTSDYLEVGVVTSVDVILGIPVPSVSDPTTFAWPGAAASARLLHGGIGTSRWDGTVAWPGAILTSIFNYAIPGLFLIAGGALDNNAWFKTLSEDKPLVAKLLGLALGIVGAETSGVLAIPNVEAMLTAMADAIAGLLVHVGLEKLQEYIVEKLGEEAMEDSIPGVNLFFQIANRAVDLVEIGETTVEVLTSPAVYEVSIVRTVDVTAVVGPDPTHGTSTQPPVWPTTATTWETIVQYRGGTAHTQTGSMTGLSSPGQPITVDFAALPAGGTIQVKFNVYADSGFLCGQFTSAWQTAGLPDGGQVVTITGSIQENLVPLSATTQYQYLQKLVYDQAAAAHLWQPAEFSLDASAAASLDAQQITQAIDVAFGQHAVTLGPGASVDVLDPGHAWLITNGPETYRIVLEQQTTGGQPVTVLVVNTGNIPTALVTDLDADNTGNNLATLVDITLNDKAYMLGYCWRASGQNIPAVGGGSPVATQIHAFQNISVLGTPEASLKFSPSGFDAQPAILYDQFGPAPLFSVPATFDTGLDAGGPVAADLATFFATFGHALPAGAVVVVVTAGAAWTIGLPNAPTYDLARVTDVVEVHPHPTATVSQWNFYAEPSGTQYQLRQVTLDDTTPFDMAQTVSWGMFPLPFNDAFVVHPQGYVVAVSYAQSRMMILKLPDAPAPDDQVVSAVLTSGPAGVSGRQGLMNGPVALAVSADGRILVLEQGIAGCPARIQAFDVNGNPVPTFDGAAVLGVPVAAAAGLDAGLVGVPLRQAFAAAGVPLTGDWVVRAGAATYRLVQGADAVTVTTAAADLGLSWTVTASGVTYDLTQGSTGIAVTQGGKTLFTLPAALAVDLNQGFTFGDVAAAFAANGATLTPPVKLTAAPLTLDPAVVTDLAAGTVPAALQQALTARGLPLPATATVTAGVVVTVHEPGQTWTLQDTRADTSYKITKPASGTTLDVVAYRPTVGLYDPPTAAVTYLGMCTETKGYIYVLSYTGDGSLMSDYRLDVYQPNGPWLARTTGLNAARIVVDIWRNVYALNFESFGGPRGRTEPSVSVWFPST